MSRRAVAVADFDREAAAREMLPKLLRVARGCARRVGRLEELPEYASAAHLGMADAFNSFRPGDGSLWRWAYRQVRQRCFQVRRAEVRKLHQANKVEYDWWDFLGVDDEASQEFERDADVAEMLAKLSRPDAKLIRLLYWEGLDAVQAGKRLGLSSQTVRKYRNRLLDRFREQLS